MSSSKQSLAGSLIDGRYLIERELGVGGFAAVYFARDLKMMGRNVVVKVLLDQAPAEESGQDGETFDVIKTFRKEAEALSRLDHRNIITIYDYGEMEGGQPYLILKFIDGVSLRQLVRPGGVELGRAAHIVREVSRALTDAHDAGILHRDLKPENVMLQARGGEEHVIVIDFGIARIQDSVISPKTVA
ncbi:MAG TPA: serine/threonine-protein kinase, partial [Pyrinomonadaceae bacterium]|nr:serine/threonine-protein kinase [Pyrinomonadaceae bacterium]